MKTLFIVILLITNLSTNIHAKDFILVNTDGEGENCYIEGAVQDYLIEGFGVCVYNYDIIGGKTEHSFKYGNYENGKMNGLFLEIKGLFENGIERGTSLQIGFSEYENNMRDGFHINLFGVDRYWIYKFENGIEQGPMLINYDTVGAVNEYNFMVDGEADYEREITSNEIKNFEADFIVFSNLLAETFGISDIKKYAAGEESFKDLGRQAIDIIKNFLDTMCDKYDKEFCYQ